MNRRMSESFVVTVILTFASIALAQTQAPSPVVVASVEQTERASGQAFVGTVLPARVSDVGSAVDGRVSQLPIEEGQYVSAGDSIAELFRALLEIELTGALAELERRRQVLQEMKNGSRPEEIEQAQAMLAGLAARLEYMQGRFKRFSKLAERGTTTTDELHDAQTEVQQAEALWRAGRAALTLSEAGPRAEQIAQSAAAVAVQESEVDRIEDQLSKHSIRAPFDGWVVERFTEQGQWIARGGLVARIAELDRVKIEVQVPEVHIASLVRGTEVRLEINGAEAQTWIGTIENIVPQADLLSRSFPVQVLVTNQVIDGQPVLRGGLLARAWMPVGRRGSITVIPKDALVLGGTAPMVYVVTPSKDAPNDAGESTGVVNAVQVELGATVKESVEVRGILEPGTLVVVRGNERLRSGGAVTFLPLSLAKTRSSAVLKQP